MMAVLVRYVPYPFVLNCPPSPVLNHITSPTSSLRTIKSEEEIGPDGMSIKARIQDLVDATATDIKKCANACDAYLKKKVVVKILTGAKWEYTLSRFAGHFQRRRAEFEFALHMHVGLGVDKAHTKLDDLGAMTRRVHERCAVYPRSCGGDR